MSYITNENGSRQVMFLVVMSLLIFLSIITVALRFVAPQSEEYFWQCIDEGESRFYCRIFHIRHVGLDDYFMLVALAFVIAMGVMNGFHVSYGTG